MARHEAPIAVHPSRIAADCGANWLAETSNRRSGVNAQPRRQVLYAAAVDEIFEALGSALLAGESLDALAIAD